MNHSSGKPARKLHPESKHSTGAPGRANGNGLSNGQANGASTEAGANGKAPILAEKIKELVRLAQEQGYLTYNDINDALPENMVSPDELDDIYTKLRNLEVEIVD